MKYKILITSFSLALILGSCIPGKIASFESLQPAGFSIPNKGDSLVVLNLSYYPWVDTSSFNILNKLEVSEALIVDTMIIKAIFDGLFSVLDYSAVPHLSNNNYYEVRTETGEQFLLPIDVESVNYLCETFNSSTIVSLEYYGMNFEQQYYIAGVNWIPGIELRRKLLWRIYLENEGMIGEYIDQDTVYWEPEEGFISGTRRLPPEFTVVMKDAFWLGGEEFGKYISPAWKEIERPYFYLFYDNENISLDKEGLTRLLEDENPDSKKFKAWYNYAVLLESNSQPDEALVAVEEALKLRPNSGLASDYRKKLKKAVELQTKLDKQFSVQ